MCQANQKLILTGVLLMMSFASTGASAAVPGSYGETPTFRVNYADLDLHRREGADALYARIQSAAKRVCEPVLASAPFRFALASKKSCRDKAIADAVANVRSPLLTAVYLGRNPTIQIAQK